MTDQRTQRHTGTVRRGALRQPQRPPSPPSMDARAGRIALAAALVLAGVVVGWLLGGGLSGGAGEPGLTYAVNAPASPTTTALPSPSSEEPSSTETPALTPTLEPTRTLAPTPTPTPAPASTPASTLTPTPTPISTLRPTPEPTPQLVGLVIDFPVDGEVVSSRRINVIGTAAPGATVTRDIPLWFDDHTTAGDDGLWMMPVELAEGENRLTFRVGDDPATAQVLIVTYRPVP